MAGISIPAQEVGGDYFDFIPALGGTWAADRPFMLRLTPPGRVGEFYGLYGMVGRFSAITGPFIWAVVADKLGMGRPAAVLVLLASVFAGWLVLRPVSDRSARRPGDAAAR